MAREKRTTGMEAISSKISAYAVHVDNIVFQEGFLMRDGLNREKIEEYKKQTIQYLIETRHQHPKPYAIQTPITGFYLNGKLALNHGHHRVQTVRELVSEGTLDRLVQEGVLTEEDVKRTVNIPTTRVAPPIGKDEASTKRAEALLYLKQITDNEGSNYTPLEKARTCQFVETTYGLSQADIAAFLGKSVSTVSNWLKLMSLPEEVQEDVAEGNIASTYVNELIRNHGTDKAVDLIRKLVEIARTNGKGKVTKKDAENEINPNKLTKKQIKELIVKLQTDSQRLENGMVSVPEDIFNAVISFFD